MQKPDINTARPVVPMIYAYTTPEVVRHDGWTKIGYTEQDVETRINQQTHTADISWHLEWKGNATFDDGTADTFTDKDFHAYLRKEGVEQEKGKNNEWFHITGPDSRIIFYDFRANRGVTGTGLAVIPYALREEQEEAVTQTFEYQQDNPGGEFLWNCKPRFGKTLSAYDLVQQMAAEKVLIVTNRPAIANSWFDDYCKFLGQESGYIFVSEVDALKGRAGVVSREEYSKYLTQGEYKCIEFVSLQDLKGSVYFGGQYNKLREVAEIEWDILIVDEAHEGVDTYKTDVAFDRIHRKFTLHLSGTPFKALASSKFPDNAIYNWTYADEQTKKRDWDETKEEENPYAVLPRLNMYTYQMSEIIRDEVEQGVEINGETEEYAFDLNEFFSTKDGRFVYGSSVDRFLDAMTTQPKFPFSTPELRAELKHTFWLLDRVESAKALAKKLETHPVFSEYKIILAAGDGKMDDDEENEKAFNKVVAAIKEAGYEGKTITLSVGQLTTGITIPEWTAVMMLSNVKSPSLYMQAAFRAQNPCLFSTPQGHKRKENAYVFDFDPARTLTIFEEFANDLSADTSAGRGDIETRKKHIKELLNFFPVIGEDATGELTELDAEQVLTIPRKIRSVEVVKRGFMSNFLFQNISGIFSAPAAVMGILENLPAVPEKSELKKVTPKDLHLNEDGEVEIPEEIVVGKSAELFGDKIYSITDELMGEVTVEIQKPTASEGITDRLKALLKDKAKEQVKTIVETAGEAYGNDMRTGDKRQIESKLNRDAERLVDKKVTDFTIEQTVLEQKKDDELKNRFETGKTVEQIESEFVARSQELTQTFQADLGEAMKEFFTESQKETVKTVETKVKEREKLTIEDSIRDRLRGFSRTIPSFLMAYGEENDVTLATFDSIIPDDVFLEVTSITLEQFRFLRDGGKYTDDDGTEKEFAGHLFDGVVFDDSVKEFLATKKRLSDYFDEAATEDIFDYIPPQRTNQIYTPKKVVKKMVDLLEEENPGCFNNPDKTFIDLYMKSGLYIAEVVKRLYQSEKLKELYPSKEERLKHIFEKQVYGLAPTEIIYQIALHFVLGFDEEVKIENHNLRKFDALPSAKDGTLQEKLDEIFGN